VASQGVNGVAVGLATVGGILLWAAVRNVPPVDIAKDALGKPMSGKQLSRPFSDVKSGVDSTPNQGPTGTAGIGEAPATSGLHARNDGRYKLGPVKAWTEQEAYDIGTQFGLKTIGGWRASDPYPDHPSGKALDLMINNIPNGKAVGDAMAAWLIKNASGIKMKYIIWQRQSWNPQRGTWVKYTGSNPHTDHVHITFDI
jgi:hypothetical protein